jgi:murein DD-endopeptidase MepM/ murein hydrolase activator NlpD
MNMQSVIGDQKISRRRKPVRSPHMQGNYRFHFETLNPVHGMSILANQRILRLRTVKPLQFEQAGARQDQSSAKIKKPRSSIAPWHYLKNLQLLPKLYEKCKQVKTHKLFRTRSGLLISAALACAVLAMLVLVALPPPESALDLSGFSLPPTEDLSLLLLHAVIDNGVPEEELPDNAAIPLTLSLINYTVATNDTLDSIAKRFGISLDTLISINSIADVRRIQAGASLKVPNIDGIVYKVQPGDNLSTIAAKHNSTLLDIVDANDLTSHTISSGQVLFIPGAKLNSHDLKKALGTLVIWPVSGKISSNFGYRNNPFTGIRHFHNGLDVVAAENTPIRASMDGKVAETGYSSLYGNFVIMTHAGSYQTLYAHLNRIDVKVGQIISQGVTVGRLGSTGYSTGPHLHFGVFKSGVPMDPLRLLRGN